MKSIISDMPFTTVEQVNRMRSAAMEREAQLMKIIEDQEDMLKKKLDLIKCGIGSNYSGNPYENDLYREAAEMVGL